jgi:hypothetical protein
MTVIEFDDIFWPYIVGKEKHLKKPREFKVLPRAKDKVERWRK